MLSCDYGSIDSDLLVISKWHPAYEIVIVTGILTDNVDTYLLLSTRTNQISSVQIYKTMLVEWILCATLVKDVSSVHILDFFFFSNTGVSSIKCHLILLSIAPSSNRGRWFDPHSPGVCRSVLQDSEPLITAQWLPTVLIRGWVKCRQMLSYGGGLMKYQ